MAFTSLNHVYLVKLQSGVTLGISAHHGFLGQTLLWAVISIYAAQVLSFWRLSTLSVWIYAWFGTWLLLISALIATSGEFLSRQVQNLTFIGQWVIDLLGIDYSLGISTIEVGSAWTYIFGAALSMIGVAIWLFIDKYRQYTSARMNS
jgi:hypothetical protein